MCGYSFVTFVWISIALAFVVFGEMRPLIEWRMEGSIGYFLYGMHKLLKFYITSQAQKVKQHL